MFRGFDNPARYASDLKFMSDSSFSSSPEWKFDELEEGALFACSSTFHVASRALLVVVCVEQLGPRSELSLGTPKGVFWAQKGNCLYCWRSEMRVLGYHIYIHLMIIFMMI